MYASPPPYALRLHWTLTRRIRTLILMLAACTTMVSPAWSQESPNEEYRLKAAFVYRFPQFSSQLLRLAVRVRGAS